ncbi:MAG TPA: hypothetical protein VNI54_11235 [Thermoanaerobaculia bacterium]|nr:hypothetical protein [Thermoanaerobaculia bacterium]
MATRRSDDIRKGGFRAALLLFGACAVAASLLWLWRHFPPAGAIDFYIIWGQAQVAGRAHPANKYDPISQNEIGEELYARAMQSGSEAWRFDARQRRGLDSTATPLLYTAFGWLPRDYERALALFRMLLIVAFVAGVLVLARVARLGAAMALFITAALVRFYKPLHMDVYVGNVGALQVLGLASFLAASPRFPATAAAILTLTIGFKPNLLPILILIVVVRITTRDFARLRREVIAGACAGIAGFAISSLHYRSPRIWLDWLGAAGDFYSRLPGREWNNVAPALALYQRYGIDWSHAVTLVLLVIGVAIVLRRRSDALAVALGILVYLISAPTVWLQYLVLLVPAAFGLVAAGNGPARFPPRRPRPRLSDELSEADRESS